VKKKILGIAKLPTSVDEYLKGVPEPARSTLRQVRAIIRKVVPPEATEGISYCIPTFKYRGMLVSYAAFSSHCSLFPGAGPITEFRNELKLFPTAKGTIRFPSNKPLPAKLLRKIVQSRIAENERKRSR
jgi:uncharacterized protein YdhG (YjbR/CyaY superfamily)